jgi:hypothetical protein
MCGPVVSEHPRRPPLRSGSAPHSAVHSLPAGGRAGPAAASNRSYRQPWPCPGRFLGDMGLPLGIRPRVEKDCYPFANQQSFKPKHDECSEKLHIPYLTLMCSVSVSLLKNRHQAAAPGQHQRKIFRDGARPNGTAHSVEVVSDRITPEGAGEVERAAYTAVCEHERPATLPSGVGGCETTFNSRHENRRQPSCLP